MSTKRLVLQNSAFNFMAGVSQRFGQVLIFILIARRLTAENTGAFKLATTYTGILLALSLWGLDQLLVREVARKKGDVGRYLSNFLLMRLLLAILIWIGLNLIDPLLPYIAETRQLIIIMTATIIPGSISDILYAVWVAFEDVKKFSAVMFFFSLVRLAGGAFILWQRGTLIFIAYWFLLVSIIEMITDAWITYHREDVHISIRQIDLAFWVRNLKLATPLIFVYLILTVEYQFDNIILSLFWPEEIVGTYGTAVTILTLCLFLTRSFQLAIFPVISRAHNTSQAYLQRVYIQSMKFLLLASFPIALLISLFSTEVIQVIFGSGYEDAGPMLRILIWAFFISAFNVANSRLLIVANHQRMMVLFAFFSMTGSLLLSLWLVPRFGGIGTAWARVLAMPFYSIPALFYVQRHLCPVSWREFWRLDFNIKRIV